MRDREHLESPWPDLTSIWGYIDTRCVGSPPRVRGLVRSAIANSVIEGYLPSAEAIDDLVDFASGVITDEQHLARVLARAGVQRRPAQD
ncbi:MAG: Antitoxin VbhA [Mycobacterium sp.]|nr:Antitoxin VbhA [Mycobacterium sp.]